MAGRLFKHLVSFCHKCGHQDSYNLSIRKYKETMYIVSFVCPKCKNENEVVCGKEDLDDYFGRNNSNDKL